MFSDGVIESSTTTGTASYELVAAVGSGRRFQQDFADGAEVAFYATTLDKTKWEFGTGVLTVGPPCTLTRASIKKSSNAGAKIDWQVTDTYLVYSIASADVLAGLMAGNLAETRPWWVRTGGRWMDRAAGLAVSWIDKLATGASSEVRIGIYDAVKNAYFADGRRPWTAVGAGNKTVAAADIGGIFTFNNSAAARTLTLPAHGDAGIGHGFKVGALGLTSGGAYGIVVTPAAGDGIEGGADGAAKTIPGGVRFDIVWDQASDTWRVEYLNAPIAGPRQTIEGLTYANGSDATNDIDIAAGGCWDSTGAYWMQMAAITKQLDATWAVGTNQGGRLSGSLADGDFNIWAIGRPDTGVIDVGLETTANAAPTLPTNYTYYRKIGWFKRASGTIVAFKVHATGGGGINFVWSAPTTEVNASLSVSRREDAIKVPLNFSVMAQIRAYVADGANNITARICCPDEADTAVSGAADALANVVSQPGATATALLELRVRTSATGTIAARAAASLSTYKVSTIGFEWGR